MNIKSRTYVKSICLGVIIILIILSSWSSLLTIRPIAGLSERTSPPEVTINISPYDIVYEGDLVDCSIVGEVTRKYWQINELSEHTTFIDNDPLIFDPEPTPLGDSFVNLTVYAENTQGNDSDTVVISLKRLFFGDIHWHTSFSDGNFDIDTMYQNAISDNYLDFAACTDHGELIDGFNTLYQGFLRFGRVPRSDLIKTLIDKILRRSEWQTLKEKAIEYYTPGNFSTLLGFEWTAAEWSPGGHLRSPHGWEDVGHINFYYKDVYPNAGEYSDLQKLNYNAIFRTMANEWDKGHLNIGYPHHPQGKASWVSFTTNWTFLAKDMRNSDARDKILRGAEIFSRWGSAIGQTYSPGVPWLWPYPENQFYNQTDAWVENALWEWSANERKGQRFGFIASSDTHDYNRPGSALFNVSHLGGPSGIVAVYAVHNTRGEIWDALNNCSNYGLQLLKIRVNVRFDGQMALGSWIDCTRPLEIQITAYSPFSGVDHSGKTMCPQGYNASELVYPICDIWLVKKDTSKGRPWCKVVNHTLVNDTIAAVTFYDYSVEPNDFYYVVIKQQGALLSPGNDSFLAFAGPVFIDTVND